MRASESQIERTEQLPRNAGKKAVVVHGGARDRYQVAQALADAGLLETLVTDLFWDEETRNELLKLLPGNVLQLLRRRSASGLHREQVRTLPLASIGGLLLDRMPGIPFTAKQRITRKSDTALGRAAGRLARGRDAALLSYSYCGYGAFSEYGAGGMLFQVHPHPVTMRRILKEELARFPDSEASLQREWELSLPEEDFRRLVQETAMASRYLVASSFTRASLQEQGIPGNLIDVVPYGIDAGYFRPDPNKARTRITKLKLLFVGRISQRKGIRYLLQALDLLRTREVEVVVMGRIADDMHLFEPYRKQLDLRTNVSAADLLRAYQTADMFVFPSVGEGFGHVLLEAMACGLPVLTTTHTAAPDLIEDGTQGFVLEPRQPEFLAERIDWALRHRALLTEMSYAARVRAQEFTWERFRTGVAGAVRRHLGERATLSDREAA